MPAVPYEITTGGICELVFEYQLNNQLNIALFHYLYTDTPIIEDGAAFLYNLMTTVTEGDGLGSKFKACISEDVGEIAVYAQWISPDRYAYVTHPEPMMSTGPADAMPQNVAVAITKRGAVANRTGIGTLHMGGVPAAWIVNGMVVQPVGDPYQTLANEIALDVSVEGDNELTPILFNRTTPLDSQIIAECYVQDTARIMRRRTVGLGA